MTQHPIPEENGAAVVGRYRLLGRIGEGGMGVVHLAEGPEGRRVALKVLRPHVVGDDEARERLAREVASLRRVHSERVAEVIDADPWGPVPFVATRYVPGPTLHEHVRRAGPVTGPDLAHLATGLMEALIAVHQVGVLHRDVKPSNVLLEGRSPVLIDFGLARLAEDPRLTQTGWLLGTPGYLAPEILYGDDATTASDVHSWAATVVFAATGAPPFGTGPAMAIMDRVRRGEHQLSAVPPALLPLVRACLAPDPAARPATFEVLSELRRTAPRPRPVQPTDPPTVPLALVEPPTRVDPPLPPLPPTAVARAPYQQPPPPRPWPAPARTGPPLARAAVLGGVFASAALGAAWAPYVGTLVLALLVWVVRALSWSSDAARGRRERRGRRRWYDAPLAVASTPWYLLLAAAGTAVLVGCAAVVALAAGVAYLLFGGPLQPGLVLMGAVLALSLWWGPGGRRLRRPLRRAAGNLTAEPGTGWTTAVVLLLVAAACAYGLAVGGVDWRPAAGAPWRAGTSLGAVLAWL